MITLDAAGVRYRDLNQSVRALIAQGHNEIELVNVNGQRYIGAGLSANVKITIHGYPGNDLAVLTNGPTIEVFGNAQDGIGNTMNEGTIIVHGNATDILGYSMRGGRIFVQGDVGYRVGIHMKAYEKKVPQIVIGGRAGCFFGEYMAGGTLILLGLGCDDDAQLVGDYVGTGMHGGTMYIRGKVEDYRLGKEVAEAEMTDQDREVLKSAVNDFCSYFGCDEDDVMSKEFHKYVAANSRPYGRMYAY